MILVMCYYKRQGNQAVWNELPFSTVGWVVAQEPVFYRVLWFESKRFSIFSVFSLFFFFLGLGSGLGLGLDLGLGLGFQLGLGWVWVLNTISQSSSEKVLLGCKLVGCVKRTPKIHLSSVLNKCHSGLSQFCLRWKSQEIVEVWLYFLRREKICSNFWLFRFRGLISGSWSYQQTSSKLLTLHNILALHHRPHSTSVHIITYAPDNQSRKCILKVLWNRIYKQI